MKPSPKVYLKKNKLVVESKEHFVSFPIGKSFRVPCVETGYHGPLDYVNAKERLKLDYDPTVWEKFKYRIKEYFMEK